MSQVRQAKRTPYKRFFEDPFVGLWIALFCAITWLLPLRAAQWFGRRIGTLVYCFAWKRNKIALKNMSVGIPEVPVEERRKLIKKMWQHFGMLFAEVAHGDQVLRESKFVNLDLLREARATGKGGFICSAHLGNWEMDVPKMVGNNFQMNPVYRKANNPWLDKLLFDRRCGVKIPKGTLGARLMLETLNKGDFIAILCDQKLREGEEIPFFGKPAMTATAMASLAIKKDVPIFMVKGIRGKDNKYTFTVQERVKIPTGLPVKDAVRETMVYINNLYWDWIRTNPEQYLWVHRRFDKSFYED